MKISYLFTSFIAWACFFNSQALAATPSCATPPSCEDLGYNMSTDQCDGFMLKCPFDQSKAFCASYKQSSGICDVGMIYDITTHKCHNEFPDGSLSNLYYIVERNGNDAIMLYLNQFESNSTSFTNLSTIKTMISQTIEANGKEYFTSEELRKIWGKQPFVSGTASLYAKVGNSFSNVFVKDGLISLKSDLSYTFTAEDWSSYESNHSSINGKIFKVKLDLTGASNDEITSPTPVTYYVDVEYPSAGKISQTIYSYSSCSVVRGYASNQNYCTSESDGLTTTQEVKNAFGTNAALKEFLSVKRGNFYPIVFTSDGCIFMNQVGDVTFITSSDNVMESGYSDSSYIVATDSNYITAYQFCKYAQ